MNLNKRWIFTHLLPIILVVIVVAGGFFCYYKYFARGALIVNSFSGEAKIVIDDQTFDNSDHVKIKLKPQNYIFSIEKEGFQSMSGVVTIKPLGTTKLDINLVKAENMCSLGDNTLFLNFSEDKLYFYDQETNNFNIIDLNNNCNVLASQKLSFLQNDDQIINAKWSPDYAKVIVQVRNDSRYSNYLIDLNTDLEQIIINIDENLKSDFVWYDNSYLIIAIDNKGKTNFYKYNIENKSKLDIFEIEDDIFDLNISPDNKYLNFYSFNLNSLKTYLNIFDIDSLKNEKIDLDDQDLAPISVKWSPDSTKILYINKNKNSLKIINIVDNFHQKDIKPKDKNDNILTSLWFDNDSIIYTNTAEEVSGDVNDLLQRNIDNNDIKKIDTVPADIKLIEKNDNTIFLIDQQNNLYKISI